ncbi:MAG TPA: protein kinase [Kofleriaceae bacterium]
MAQLASLPTPGPDLFAPGTMLGRYELLSTIGEGGMARVMLARHLGPVGFEKLVVVKVIHPRLAETPGAIGMLLDEARVAAQINHQNVVQTYELGEAHGTFYIVMEYLAGETLQQIVETAALGPSLDPRMAARIVAAAAEGLHFAHELEDARGRNLGLVHRDVSLGNVIVLYNGGIKVVDFGIAKTHDRVSTTTQHGQMKGKYAYMSPEQIRNEPMDRRSDVFSLGIVLWEALALRRLFDAEHVPATLMQIITAERVAPSKYRPEVPPALDAIALRALAVDPDHRFQTALDMKRALEDAIWESRCDADDLRMYMTAVFGDRIRKRQSLLASADARREGIVREPQEIAFEDMMRQFLAPPIGQPEPEPEPRRRRSFVLSSVIAICLVLCGWLGIRVVEGRSERRATSPTAPIALTPVEPRVVPIQPAPAPAPAPAPTIVTPRPPPPAVSEPVGGVRPTQTPLRRTKDRTAAKAHAARGTELFIAGSFADAVAAYKQALASDRDYAPAHRGLGYVYQRMGFTREAIVALRRYLALAPKSSDVTTVKERIEQMGGQL